jgi:hypothetical protein
MGWFAVRKDMFVVKTGLVNSAPQISRNAAQRCAARTIANAADIIVAHPVITVVMINHNAAR